MPRIRINAFKIDTSKISKVNYYSLEDGFNDDVEMFSFSWRNGGIFKDGYFLTLLNYEEISDKDLLEWVKSSPFPSNDIATNTDLLHRYTSFKLKKQGVLDEIKTRIKQSLLKRVTNENIGRFVWDVEVFDDVIFNGEFYYALNFKIRIFCKKNIWDYVGRNPERLKGLKGKGFRFEANPKRIYYIGDVRNDKDEFMKILDYLNRKYPRYMQRVEIDKNQPIILGSRGYIRYPYLPQLCFLSVNFEEIEGWELKEFRKLWLLTNSERFEIIKYAFEKGIGKEREILEVDSRIYPKPEILVNQRDGIILGEGYEPYDVPEILPEELDTYIIIDENLSYDSVRDIVDEFINRFNSIHRVPKLRVVKSVEFSPEKIGDIYEETDIANPLAFSLILFRIKYQSSNGEKPYEKIKRLLFKKNIISQALIYSNINEKNGEIILKNLLVQSMSKLGIKAFTLKGDIPYDYIIGVDVGRTWRGGLGVGGCSVVITGDGVVKRIVPISQPTTGDTLKISRFLEEIHAKDKISGKRVLVLRDGNLRKDELEDLNLFVKDYGVEGLTYMNVVKRHRVFMVSEEDGEGIVFGDGSGLLLPHGKEYKKVGPKPIRIKDKYVFDKGGFQRVKVSYEDLRVLNDLTYLVFSMLPFIKRIKLPAPVYLADRFVKALSKGWRIKEELLENGLLYFL